MYKIIGISLVIFMLAGASAYAAPSPIEVGKAKKRPNIILIMTDDQGWGQTGYYNHPILKTPHLDAMAKNGLRFDRFYAGAPVCSPTRASVLTGRANDRTGVKQHGYPLRPQEKSIATALKAAGYATGHFGKWHLNGLRGPGVPVLKGDAHGPGAFGFDTWLTTSNFFDINPLLSANGDFKSFKGDSSKVIVDEALKFIEKSITEDTEKPFFTVIWDGSPHGPFEASEADRKDFAELDRDSQHHYGEMVAFDRALGVLRKRLRSLGIADDTILWFNSDNGGLNTVNPNTVGDLRGAKGSIWEGGLRVPAIIEWPGKINPQITDYPASTMDIFPTIAALIGLPDDVLLKPVDGDSLVPLFKQTPDKRSTSIPFFYMGKGALIDNEYKLVALSVEDQKFELYNLATDAKETTNLAATKSEIFKAMKAEYLAWYATIEDSIAGKDYPEGKVLPNETDRQFWSDDPRYFPYFEEWKERPEYEYWFKNREFKTQ